MSTLELPVANPDRYRRHAEAISFLGRIAKDMFGVELSDRTLENWTYANLLIKDVDSVFDDKDEQAKQEVTQKLKRIFGPYAFDEYLVNDSTTYFAKELRSHLNTKQAELFLKRGLQIVELQNELRAEPDPKKYAEIVLLEGQMQANMFVHIVDPSDKEQPNYQKFENFFLNTAGVANLYDSITDIKADNLVGQTAVEPSLSNRVEMMAAARRDIAKTMSSLSLKHTTSFISPLVQIAKDRDRTPEM